MKNLNQTNLLQHFAAYYFKKGFLEYQNANCDLKAHYPTCKQAHLNLRTFLNNPHVLEAHYILYCTFQDEGICKK